MDLFFTPQAQVTTSFSVWPNRSPRTAFLS